MKTKESARAAQRRYYERNREIEIARQKAYREKKAAQGVVPVPVKGWGYLPYWEVPF